jgi:AcrR family transcriptional regulator
LGKLALQGGIDFSLSELVRSLNVSPAATYKHFADKDALVAELAAIGFARPTQGFEVATPKDAAVRTKRRSSSMAGWPRASCAGLQSWRLPTWLAPWMPPPLASD